MAGSNAEPVEEIELKLELAPVDAHKIIESAFASEPSEIRHLHSIYFDTPDFDLFHAGLLLRVRRSGEKRIQTVKASGGAAAGVFARPEWERPVADDMPVLNDSTPVKAALGDRITSLGPAFTVDVERTTWLLDDDGATMEIALDRGTVQAGDRATPICEIEIELKKGKAAALFALARRLNAVAPVRPSIHSKAERGYRLLQKSRKAYKGEPPILTADMNAAEAFQQIARTCLQQYRLNEMVLLEERQPDAVHQARVSLRRLRSAFSIFRHLFADDMADRLREDLRWLANEMGDARNLDVLIARSGSEIVAERLRDAYDAAYLQVETAIASERSRTLLLDLAQWLQEGEWLFLEDTRPHREQPVKIFAMNTLDRCRRKVKKGGRDLKNTDDETRHELRKQGKKLRYTAEFFSSLFTEKTETADRKRFLSILEDVQDHLGHLNDLATTPLILQQYHLDDLPEAEKLLDDGRKKSLHAAADSHAELVAAPPFWRRGAA